MASTRDVEREQISGSTDRELSERLIALRQRYDPNSDGGLYPGGGYPMQQLREMQLILEELRDRDRERFTDPDRADADDWVADNHVALDRATDVERYR